MQRNPLSFPVPIDVPLREHRTYIQSASLFDFLIDKTGVSRNIALSFRRKIECEIDAISAQDSGDSESFPARFSGDSDDAQFDLAITERKPLKRLERREPYNEHAVIADSKIDGLTIHSESGNGASAIDRIVALNKRLISQSLAPKKVLIFSKIFLRQLPQERPLRIELKSHLGSRLFRSAIFADGGEVGEIIFYGT